MQAARGASLNPSADSPTQSRSGMRYRLVFAAVALTAYLVDVGSKVLAVDRLSDGREVQVVGDLLTLHLTRNPGAAFSTGPRFTLAFSCLAIVAVIVVLWFARRLGSLGWAWALGFLIAGIAGNLTDRVFRDPGPLRGHVVDFFALPNWPIFNVADICIDVGAGLILLMAFRNIGIDGHRADPRPNEPEPAE